MFATKNHLASGLIALQSSSTEFATKQIDFKISDIGLGKEGTIIGKGSYENSIEYCILYLHYFALVISKSDNIITVLSDQGL